MDSKSRGLIKSLENWARRITTGYKDVNIQNLSSSFRDGLAFCAIIHHYRPDLIDFDSLSKENIFENNSVAFKVAEKSLGVPALLDAEDMVEYAHPDRLSIITYLSQLYNCFENQNNVKSMKSNLKRINQNETVGPPLKLPVVQPALLTTKRHEVCRVCNHRVYILERLIVDGKLYHTQCFKCSKCNCLLNPGAYVESDNPGLYECSVCPDESLEERSSPEASVSEEKNEIFNLPNPKLNEKFTNPSPLMESVSRARNSFLQNSLSSYSKLNDSKSLKENSRAADPAISVKAKISAFETNQTSTSVFKPTFTNDIMSRKSPTLAASSEDSSLATISPTPNERFSLISTSNSLKTTEYHNVKIPQQISSKVTDHETESGSSDNINKPNSINQLDSEIEKTSKLSVSLKPKSTDELRLLHRPLSITNDYKSPLKSPRDIFQTNIQPLKLSISSNKKEPSNLSASGLESKSFQIPQIRSTYSSLPRPGSSDSFLSKDQSSKFFPSNSENNIDIMHSKCSETSIAQKSLESNLKNGTYAENSSTNFEKHKSFDRSLSSSELKTSSNFPINDLPETDIDSGNSSKKLVENLENKSSGFFPVPTARISLEKHLKSSLTEENSEALSFKNEIAGNSSAELLHKNSTKVEKEKETSMKHQNVPNTESEEDYPDDLNPFGDDEGDNENQNEEYPDDLNPFGDDDENNLSKTDSVYDDSKNPFASDDDEEEQLTPAKSLYSKSPLSTDSSFQNGSFSSISSPTGSLSGTARKRQAPKPPKLSDIFPTVSLDSEHDSSLTSVKSSPATSNRNLQTPSPKVRKSKPAPPPPPTPPTSKQNSQTDVIASSKKAKEIDNMKLKSAFEVSAEKDAAKQIKKKKRPAPPVPIPVRKDMKKIPVKEIIQEMKEIEEKQREYERQGREIELLIRDRDKDEEPSVEEEEYIMQLFELVNQKNALFRRQAELMYIKRSQRLEEQQCEIDKQLRLLMEKPESDKTDEDRQREEDLTMELIDIVDQRNSIIDSIEMDRRREIEEDVSVQVQLEIKNGDLPITAEIKEKSGKVKKSKNKKEKKKQQAENGSNSSSKKGTLKKNFIKKLTS